VSLNEVAIGLQGPRRGSGEGTRRWLQTEGDLEGRGKTAKKSIIAKKPNAARGG